MTQILVINKSLFHLLKEVHLEESEAIVVLLYAKTRLIICSQRNVTLSFKGLSMMSADCIIVASLGDVLLIAKQNSVSTLYF